MTTVTAGVYLQIEPEIGVTGAVVGARVVTMTQRRPASPRPDAVVVNVQVKLPRTAFDHLVPTAVVEVPEGWYTSAPRLSATAGEPVWQQDELPFEPEPA